MRNASHAMTIASSSATIATPINHARAHRCATNGPTSDAATDPTVPAAARVPN
jgi:hypothetical protein